jgi:hypothetical protein
VVKKKLNTERWFLRQLESSIRRQPNGERAPDCVDDTFLQSYAEDPTDFSLSDQRVKHVTCCRHCLSRHLQLRATRPAKSSLSLRYMAVAARGLGYLLVGFVVAHFWSRKHPTVAQVQPAELHRTLNLSQYGTCGDRTTTNPPLLLPGALLILELVLPRLSQPGAYDITVATGENGIGRVASARGIAAGADSRTVVTVPLDLRQAKPGKYVLSTQFQDDDPSYTYPLEIEQ